jgi:hypothetical protein
MSIETVVDTSIWPCATVGLSWALSETFVDIFTLKEQDDDKVIYSLDMDEFPEGRYIKKFRGLRDIHVDFPSAKYVELCLNGTLIERQEASEDSTRMHFTSFQDSFILPFFVTDSLEIHVYLTDDAFLPRTVGSLEALLFEYKNSKPFCISSPKAQSIITYDGSSDGLNIVVKKSLLKSRRDKLQDTFVWNLRNAENDDTDFSDIRNALVRE